MEKLSKKLFKDAFVVNLLFMGATVSGYLLIVPGILFHITLGVMQAILLLLALLQIAKYSKVIQLQLILYGIPCIWVLTHHWLNWDYKSRNLMMEASVPLAIFFTIILYQLKRHYYGTQRS